MIIRSSAFFCISIFTAGLVFAQTGPSLRILIENPDREAENCGVRESALRDTAGFVMNSARIRQAASSEYGTNTLHISTSVVYNERINVCYGTMKVEVYGYTVADLRNEPLAGFISDARNTILCSRGGLVVGQQSTFSESFNRMAENAAKQCLGRLKY